MEHYLKVLERTVKEHWDEAAVCNFGSECFTYADLASNIEKFHIFFEKTGIRKQEHIALCAKSSARWGISFFSIATYGAVVVPLLSDFTADSIVNLVNHSDSTILFTDSDIWENLKGKSMPGIKAVVAVNNFTLLYSVDESIRQAFENLPHDFEAKFPMGYTRENVDFYESSQEDVAVINYTSGTTSAPKGVIIQVKCFSAMLEFAAPRSPIFPGDKIVSMLPMGHIYGLVFEFLYPVSFGCPVYFFGKVPSPTLLLRAMAEVKPYMIVSVPLVMEKIYKSGVKPALSKFPVNILKHIPGIRQIIYNKAGKKLKAAFGGNVRMLIMGGAAVNPEVEKAFRLMKIPFLIGYGLTEAAPLLTFDYPSKFKLGTCGKEVPSAHIRIDSEDPHHIAGEIQAIGINICKGYYKNPEATANAFTEDGYFRTGDLGILDKDNNLIIKGRLKTMILSANGQNIYPEELESIINSQAYVSESIVVDRNGKIVALIVLDKDAIKRDNIEDEAIADIPETVRVNTNRELPSYSKIAKVEVMLHPFEKTPKMSIKRYLYK